MVFHPGKGSMLKQEQRAVPTPEGRDCILGMHMIKPMWVSGHHLRDPQVLRNIGEMNIMSHDGSPT